MFHSTAPSMLIAFGSLLCCQTLLHAEDYPYTAYVTADQTEVRCGPSAHHYMTHRVFAGDEVQVFRREATGWLAIQPPEDSHCWIPADVVEGTSDEGVYRVLLENPAYIGTPDKSVMTHHYQVRLHPGELVKVIGEKTLNTANGVETWLKIAPPAGEFRWIHINQVSKSPPRDENLDAQRARNLVAFREVQTTIGFAAIAYHLLQSCVAMIGVFIYLARRRVAKAVPVTK